MRSRLMAVWRRMQALAKRARLERDLDEEIAFHRAMLAEKGQAGRKFGNELRLREATREAWMFAWLESLGQDLRYALRGLRRSPGFTCAVVATLALGIGANSAIFSLAYGVLWKPLPYPDASRIVAVNQAQGAIRDYGNSTFDINQARGQDTGFAGWALYDFDDATLTDVGVPELLRGLKVESSLFAILGAKPLLGRLIGPSDDRPGAPSVVVISAPLWRERWGGRRNVIGQTIILDGKPSNIVGVLPASFQFQGTKEAYWRAWQSKPEPPGGRDAEAIARLAPGVTLAQAQARLNLEMQRLAAAHPLDRGWSFVLTPLRQDIIGGAAPALWLMLAVVGLVLLIAAANVACLLLARAQRRERELATRAALGASRARILRQLGTETGVLLAAGALAGLVLAALGIAWLRAAAPRGLPLLGAVDMNSTVVAFTLAVLFLIGIIIGLAPALAASGRRLNATLRPAPAALGGSRGRGAWVVAQVALALLLLAGAGLLLAAFLRMSRLPLGFNPEHTLTFLLELPEARYPNSSACWRFFQVAQAKLAALPGVSDAATASFLPLGGLIYTGYSLPGHPLRPNDSSQESGYDAVSANYLETMQIPLLAGRGFGSLDAATATPVAVISQALARAAFAGQNPIGKRIKFDLARAPWRTVVGVAANVQPDIGIKPAPPGPMGYVPLAQTRFVPPNLDFVLRGPGDPFAMTASARRAVASLDPQLPIATAESLEQTYAEAVAEPRFRSFIVAGFALLALLLTAVGIYGVLAYSVGARTQEFGVRAALGARPEQVLALVLRQALALLGLGLGIGLGAVLLLTRYLADLLYGVSPTDPWVLGATLLLLAGVGLGAATGPARRAMRVDPARALRCE